MACPPRKLQLWSRKQCVSSTGKQFMWHREFLDLLEHARCIFFPWYNGFGDFGVHKNPSLLTKMWVQCNASPSGCIEWFLRAKRKSSFLTNWKKVCLPCFAITLTFISMSWKWGSLASCFMEVATVWWTSTFAMKVLGRTRLFPFPGTRFCLRVGVLGGYHASDKTGWLRRWWLTTCWWPNVDKP